jgi:hypothetical protein
MRARIAALLAAALLAAALFATGATAGGQKGGHLTYRGKTSQKKAIRILVAPDRITLLGFGARLLCRDGSVLYANAAGFEATKLSGGGHFSDVQYGAGNTVSWQGRARAAKVVGRLRITARLKGGVHCDSQPVRFAVKRG